MGVGPSLVSLPAFDTCITLNLAHFSFLYSFRGDFSETCIDVGFDVNVIKEQSFTIAKTGY